MDEPNYQITDASGTVIGEIGETNSGGVAIEHASSGETAVLDADGLDVGSVSTDELFTEPAAAILTKTSTESIADGSVTEVSWDSATELNADADQFADLANNQVTIPNNEYTYARVTFALDIVNSPDLNRTVMQSKVNGGFKNGLPKIDNNQTNVRSLGALQSAWIPITSGDSFNVQFLQSSTSAQEIDDAAGTFFQLEAI